jgi:hypothetical protein
MIFIQLGNEKVHVWVTSYFFFFGPFLKRRDVGEWDEKRQGVVMDNLACRYQINANF